MKSINWRTDGDQRPFDYNGYVELQYAGQRKNSLIIQSPQSIRVYNVGTVKLPNDDLYRKVVDIVYKSKGITIRPEKINPCPGIPSQVVDP